MSQFVKLVQRAKAAYREGGATLFLSRFKRWARHQYARWLPSNAYQNWIREHEPTSDDLQKQREWSASVPEPRRFSILCPLHNTPIAILEDTMTSVLNQTYSHWELCLTLSQQEPREFQDKVLELSKKDQRIRVIPISKNNGISANTNTALAAARGEWVAFLDHDDRLAPNALYAVAQEIAEHPKVDVIYSDEDLLATNGKYRKTPVLKPGWSPEMLLHFNYICHFVALKTSLVREVGGLRPQYDGAQDWDLLLRISEHTNQIQHIPQILYHWREHRTSTASNLSAKPYVVKAQQQVLEDCYQRRGMNAEVVQVRDGHFRPKWKVAKDTFVSIIIPSRNQLGLLRPLVQGLLEKTEHKSTEIIIVDNNSSDPSVLKYYEELTAQPQVKVVDYHKPFNYSAACNCGARTASGEYLLFLNNDMEILRDDWLSELLGWGKQAGVGMVGTHLVYPNGRTQHAGIVLGLYHLVGHIFHQSPPETPSPFGLAEWTRNVSAVTGACQLVPRELFNSLGGYDENYTLLYSDIEMCLRVQRTGLRVVYTPHAKLIHHECTTRPPTENAEDARRFAQLLTQEQIYRDPYYHPALTATSTVPQLRPVSALNIEQNLARQIQSVGNSNIPNRVSVNTNRTRAA